MKQRAEQTILLVSDDAELCAAARREFETRNQGFRVTAISGIEAARRAIENMEPAVILFDEMPQGGNGNDRGQRPQLNSVVSALAVHAPVVVIGEQQQQTEVAALVTAGAADFVARGDECLPVAFGLLDRRLQHSRQLAGHAEEVFGGDGESSEGFGEVLRHELNNPLTGILGNAELLLAEVRRKNDGRMPQGGQQRLETIAALAVRLRETVRRLSQEWETRQQAAQ